MTLELYTVSLFNNVSTWIVYRLSQHLTELTTKYYSLSSSSTVETYRKKLVRYSFTSSVYICLSSRARLNFYHLNRYSNRYSSWQTWGYAQSNVFGQTYSLLEREREREFIVKSMSTILSFVHLGQVEWR